VFIDFVLGNLNRSQSNALTMIALFPSIFTMINIIGVWFVFGPSQLLQANVTYLLVPKYGRRALFVALMLPISGVVTWYCFDYLTPSNIDLGINEGPDWTPYQHGISPLRFVVATGIQAVVTTFTLAYCGTRNRRPVRKQFLLAVLLITILGGIALGYRSAKVQYQFLDRPNITSPDAK
jgi:hypothetical protein